MPSLFGRLIIIVIIISAIGGWLAIIYDYLQLPRQRTALSHETLPALREMAPRQPMLDLVVLVFLSIRDSSTKLFLHPTSLTGPAQLH